MYNNFLALSDLTDTELIQLVQNRDEAAFAELMSRYTPRIRHVIVANSRHLQDAEEISNDIWISVWQNITGLRNVDSFGPWLHRIALNACKRYYTLARQSRSEIPHLHSEIIEHIDQAATARFRNMQLIADAKEAVHHLPQKVRSVAELYYLESWSVKDIAAEFTLTEGTVKTKLRETRELLRKEFGVDPSRGGKMVKNTDHTHQSIKLNDRATNNIRPKVLNAIVDDPSGNTWALQKDVIVRFGKGDIQDIKLSPDGTCFAVGSGMGLWWYDTSTMLPISLWEPQHSIGSTAFSHDGKWIVADTVDDILKVYDVESGECVMQFEEQDAYGELACSSNGKWVAAAEMDGIVTVLNIQNGTHIAQMDRGNYEWRSNDIWQLEFSPDGNLLAATAGNSKVYNDDDVCLNPDTEGTQIYVWDPKTGKQIIKFAGREFVFSSDSRLIAGAAADETLKDDKRVDRCVSVWDITSGEQIAHFSGHEDWVDAVAFSPCGQFVASSDGTLRVWVLASGTQKMEFPNYDDPFYTEDGRLLALVYLSSTNTIEVWDVEDRDKLLEISVGIGRYGFAKSIAIAYKKQLTDSSCIKHTEDGIPSFSIVREPEFPWPSPKVMWVDDQTLASTIINNGIMLWDIEDKCWKGPLLENEWIHYFTVLPSGKILAMDYDYETKIWDVNNPKKQKVKITTASVPTEWYHPRVLAPSGDQLGIGGKNGTVYVWNFDNPESPILLKGHTDEILSLAFSPDGKQIVTGSKDNSVKVWDVALGEEISELHIDTQSDSLSIVFSPCGNLIAGELNQEIRLWCAKEYKTVRVLPQNQVYRRTCPLVFSACSKYLAGATWWNKGRENLAIRIWDVPSGKQVHEFRGHDSSVQSMDFSPNGAMLATGCRNGTILVWDCKLDL